MFYQPFDISMYALFKIALPLAPNTENLPNVKNALIYVLRVCLHSSFSIKIESKQWRYGLTIDLSKLP